MWCAIDCVRPPRAASIMPLRCAAWHLVLATLVRSRSMWDRFRAWLNDVPLSDSIERQQAPLIQMMLIGLIVLGCLGLPLALLADNSTNTTKLISLSVILAS